MNALLHATAFIERATTRAVHTGVAGTKPAPPTVGQVKPAPFAYLAPTTVAEAVQALAADPDAVALAGGQSLLPLLALRLARPTLLVDVNGALPSGIAPAGGEAAVRIGALTRHSALEASELLWARAPALAEAAGQIGCPAVRHRGTLGGSLAHADPAAELPAVMVALDATITVEGAGGARQVRAGELCVGFLTTCLRPGELVTAVSVPVRARTGSAWAEHGGRTGDVALCGIAARVALAPDGRLDQVTIGGAGLASVPLALHLGAAVVGGAGSPDEVLPVVGAALAAGAAPLADRRASPDERRRLALGLAADVLARAWQRAAPGAPDPAPAPRAAVPAGVPAAVPAAAGRGRA